MSSTATVLAVIVITLGFTAFFGAPYVPSRRKELNKLFNHAYRLSTDDTLVDLGSGDGVVLRVARQYGARAVGYELGPVYYLVSKLLARGDKKQVIKMASYWSSDFPEDTTVVYAFSDGRDINKVGELVQRQADKLQKKLTFIALGADITGKVPTRSYRAYHLYEFTPCHQVKA